MIPTTLAGSFNSELFEETWKAGYTDLIQVTLNSKGSGTYQAAVLSRNLFYEEHPEAREQLAIHISVLLLPPQLLHFNLSPPPEG